MSTDNNRAEIIISPSTKSEFEKIPEGTKTFLPMIIRNRRGAVRRECTYTTQTGGQHK